MRKVKYNKFKISKCKNSWVVWRTVGKHDEFAVAHSEEEAQRMKEELEARYAWQFKS